MTEKTEKKSLEKIEIEKALEDFEGYPLTETQQYLVNYIRANIDDVEESMIG